MKTYMRNIQSQSDIINKNFLLSLLEEKPNSKVLDIGCNDGSFSTKVAERVGTNDIYGLDISKEMAKKATEKGLKVEISDADKKFPFEDNMFDVVISNQVIEHVCNSDHFIKEIRRILKENGTAIVSTTNPASLHNIFALLLGYQPFNADVSDEICCGNPLNPAYQMKGHNIKHHRRTFTPRALKEVFEYHGFTIETALGTGLHPFPSFIQKRIKSRYGIYSTVKSIKSI